MACSLLKLGSLEKTVIASQFLSGLHSGTIFLWIKQCHMSFWGATGYAVFWKKWFFDHLQLFCYNDFLIRCQKNVLLWRIHVSLGPKWKNPGSGVPSLIAVDKPFPRLQPSLGSTKQSQKNKQAFSWEEYNEINIKKLFISFCTMFWYIILGWYHDNLLMKIK